MCIIAYSTSIYAVLWLMSCAAHNNPQTRSGTLSTMPLYSSPFLTTNEQARDVTFDQPCWIYPMSYWSFIPKYLFIVIVSTSYGCKMQSKLFIILNLIESWLTCGLGLFHSSNYYVYKIPTTHYYISKKTVGPKTHYFDHAETAFHEIPLSN